jgi:hypothetical protein
MPGEPLKTLQDMSGGRWESFHAGSQDFAYRNVAGIVAATDGSERDNLLYYTVKTKCAIFDDL